MLPDQKWSYQHGFLLQNELHREIDVFEIILQ